jgi:hypothetical protein
MLDLEPRPSPPEEVSAKISRPTILQIAAGVLLGNVAFGIIAAALYTLVKFLN